MEYTGTNSGRCPLCRNNLGIDSIIKEHNTETIDNESYDWAYSNNSFDTVAINASLVQNEILHGVTLRCNECLSRFDDCELCCKLICSCSYNPETVNKYPDHSPRCPFDTLDRDSPKICSKCLHDRDEFVLDFMNDDHGELSYDIFSHERMHELYTLLYKDKTDRNPNGIVSNELISMSWSEFTNYAQEIYDQENQLLNDIIYLNMMTDDEYGEPYNTETLSNVLTY